MPSKLIGIVLGFGLAVALTASAMACDYHMTTATSDEASQQTAQAEPSAEPSADVSTQ